MRFHSLSNVSTILLAALFAAIAVGCSKQDGEASVGSDTTQVADTSREGDDHSDWWCAEHGVPEEDCSICSSKAADKFKAKDDWCEEHHRAESQCFECDPSRADRFAKLYEAKFGHEPPKRTD